MITYIIVLVLLSDKFNFFWFCANIVVAGVVAIAIVTTVYVYVYVYVYAYVYVYVYVYV